MAPKASASGKSSKKFKKGAKPAPIPTGWNTTDADEIERRRVRARTEQFHSQPLEPQYVYFGSFQVNSKHRGTQYRVEIRSLTEHTNSCDCPDYFSNHLGTCKHIEYVLWRLQQRRKKLFQAAALIGSPRIEIFLDCRAIEDTVTRKTIRIAWPTKSPIHATLRKRLEPFFHPDNTLRTENPHTYPNLRDTVLGMAKTKLAAHIRLSEHIDRFFEHQQCPVEKQAAKEAFLLDVEQGKQTLSTLKFPLYPYQQEGMLHLVFTKRALLADEMGLGKTVQAIAACELLYRLKKIKKVLVIATASLKAEWTEQIEKFSTFSSLIIQGARQRRLKQYEAEAFFYLTNYEQILIDGPDIQRLISPDVIILDEAQRIKNWQTKTANTVKALKSPYAFVLTGTPLENRIDDIYSVVQFLDPELLGPLFRFNRAFYQLDESGRPIGYKNLDELHQKLRPLLLRRRKGDVEGQLPTRTVNNYFVSMEKEQHIRYTEYQDRVARLLAAAKRRPLRKEEYEKLQQWLGCMRMICDSPYILDPTCRISPKLRELKNLLAELLEEETAKIIIFSEWARMLELVREHLEAIEVDAAWHTGATPQIKRRQEINRFKENPHCRIFLSTDAGSLGLNLQAANIVINLDLPWNPAKLEQRIARAWRKHQTRTVQVINLICQDSIEHRMLGLLSQKQTLAQGVLEGQDDLKEMQLPSGRAAFMERMNNLLHTSSSDAAPMPSEPDVQPVRGEVLPSQDPPLTEPAFVAKGSESPTVNEASELKSFSEHICDWAQDAIQTAEIEQTKVLAIVDNPSDPLAQALQTLGSKTSEQPSIEIIDRRTFESIQRLINNGMLSIDPRISILPAFKGPERALQPLQAQRFKQIQGSTRSFKQALRKQRLACVLMEQAFLEEAIVPFREALELAIQAFLSLFHPEDSAQQAIRSGSLLQHRLVEQYGFPKETVSLCNQVNALASDHVTLKTLQTLFTETQAIFQHIDTELTKASHSMYQAVSV